MESNNFQGRKIATLILAAGGSSRLGSPKQLIRYRETALIRRICEQVVGNLRSECVVVLGSNYDQCYYEIANLPIIAVQNNEWNHGIGSSIAIGTRALLEFCQTRPTGILICLVDQPLITADHLTRLGELYCESNAPIVASQYGGAGGVPAIFGEKYFNALLNLKGQRGAKSLIGECEDVLLLDCAEGSFDIDVNSDVIALQKNEEDSRQPLVIEGN